MELKYSYKASEVGPIPEDWDIKEIGDIVRISVGRDLREERFSSHLTNKHHFPVYSNTVSNRGLYGYYDFPEYTGDSLTVVGRGVGLGTSFTRSGGYGAIGRLLVLFPEVEIDANYLSEYINQRVTIFTESGGIPQLTGLSIAKYKVPVPPTKAEQEAIAGALSDADAYIESLEKLIAKKRLIKQGAMQELLTGKRRLPGFSGEWGKVNLGDVAHIKTGTKNNEDKREFGAYPFFVRSANIERIDTYNYDCEAILVPGEGNIGSIFHYINGRFDAHQRVYAITQFREGVSARFVYSYLSQYFGSWALQNTVKATVDSLRLPTFQMFELRLPPSEKEQNAIANTLEDMESEITIIEQQRTKANQIKQGMMQELLTGRIRLV
jgi:type I restriction enzyme, S subunit